MSKRQAIISAIIGYGILGLILAIFAPSFFMLLIPILCLDFYICEKRFHIFSRKDLV